MANIIQETVTHIHHWNESLFSFRTTREQGFRFENGHFVMLGLEVDVHLEDIGILPKGLVDTGNTVLALHPNH